jgi:hypothetical protein
LPTLIRSFSATAFVVFLWGLEQALFLDALRKPPFSYTFASLPGAKQGSWPGLHFPGNESLGQVFKQLLWGFPQA